MDPSPPAPEPVPPLPPAVPRWRRIALRVIEVGTIVVALGALGLWCSVPNTGKLAEQNPTSTAFIDLRRDEAAGKRFNLQWQWRPLGKISRYLRASVIYAEDYNFYRHDGVDWDAIEHAVEADWNKGAMAVGGSTITQQLAKNLYLSPRRSIFRKLREILIAYSLEAHLSKTRILELCLNVVEWGDGVFGAEAAARKWFGHSAQSLSPGEAARLAIALPNPIQRAPNVHTPELIKKAVRIIRMLRWQGLIDASQERAALDEVGAPDEKVLPDREVPPPEPATRQPEPPPEPITKPEPGSAAPPGEPAPSEPPGSAPPPPSEPPPPPPPAAPSEPAGSASP